MQAKFLVLSYLSVFILVKKHHDNGNTYKENHWSWLTIHRFSAWSSLWEAWYHAGIHSGGKGTQISTSGSIGRQKIQGNTGPVLGLLRPQSLQSSDTILPTQPHLLQKSHTSYCHFLCIKLSNTWVYGCTTLCSIISKQAIFFLSLVKL